MCGRFTFTDPNLLPDAFGVSGPIPELAPRYNIAPSQSIAVIALKRNGDERAVALLKWGLVPSWANDPRRGIRPINARSDSLDKPMFRDAFRSQRCLIPADGFYEWTTAGRKKSATHFKMKDSSPFAFAGLWEFWSDGVEKLATCAIITTDANEVVAAVHNRMPVIVPKSGYGAWLSNETPRGELLDLLKPYPFEDMVGVPVGTKVNSVSSTGRDPLPVEGENPGLTGLNEDGADLR